MLLLRGWRRSREGGRGDPRGRRMTPARRTDGLHDEDFGILCRVVLEWAVTAVERVARGKRRSEGYGGYGAPSRG